MAPILPSELPHVGLQPHLKRLRRDGLHVIDHGPPAGIALDDFATDVGHSSYSYTENHEIEIRSHLQHPPVTATRLEEFLEIPTLVLELLRVLELVPQRLARPAR